MIRDIEKRPLEEVNDELLALAAEQNEADLKHKQKRRRHNFAVMTQYTSTLDSSSQPHEDDGNRNEPPPPPGYIRKVILRNFMCHENFSVELTPNLNFIVGNNGSGKSAILTAIIVALGVKASETSRGSSLKELIRKGCNSSKVTLHLDNNKGDLDINGKDFAYKHDQYGDIIIIERTIKKDSGASFSLKSIEGIEISSKKKDLQDILDYFSIPVNNSMFFLTQDMAKSFLTASNASDKYDLFMNGTLLNQIKNNLDRSKEITSDARNNMSFHSDTLGELGKEYQEATTLLNSIRENSTLLNEQKVLQGKSLWIDINHNRKSVHTLEKEIASLERDIRKSKDVQKSTKDTIERLRSDRVVLDNDIERLIDLQSQQDNEYQTVKEEKRTFKNRYDKELQKQEEVKENINRTKSRIEVLERTIEKLDEESRNESGTNRDELRTRLLKLEESNKEIDESRSILTTQLQDKETEYENLISNNRKELKFQMEEIKRKKIELDRGKQGNHHFLNNFNQPVNIAVDVIRKNSKRFKVEPIGPIGSYISVKHGYEKWARPIQKFLGQILNSFIVSDFEDLALLKRLIAEREKSKNALLKRLSFINYSYDSFNYDQSTAKTKYPTIVDALEFKSPVVENFIVDNHKIENILLIENTEEARNFLKSRPKNVIMALTCRTESAGCQISGFGLRIDTVKYDEKSRLRTSSLNSDTVYLANVISGMEREFLNSKKKIELNEMAIKLEKDKLREEIRSYAVKYNKNEDEIKRLTIINSKVIDASKLNAKKSELDQEKLALNGYDNVMKELESNKNEILEESKPCFQRLDATKEAFEITKQTLSEKRSRIEKGSSAISSYEEEIKDIDKRMYNYQSKIEKIKDNIKVLEEGISNQIDKALTFCTEEESVNSNLPEDQTEIKKQLLNISTMIQESEKRSGLTHEEIISNFEKCEEKYTKAYQKYNEVEDALIKLEASINERIQTYTETRSVTFTEALGDFISSLKVRNFKGRLVFDTEKKLLDIDVGLNSESKLRSVDTLSGGEKSFSQMALLLATWKPMKSRIIALDEFDVFMDQVNRTVGIKLIIKKLHDLYKTQTIIITPQDIERIADIERNGVNIQRIRDPDRRNNSNYHS
ncbi:hypothetical protein Kpol_483p10 [Vanderwaltozyma polyspora DSM 70294]|uniref:Rad50/SbcC-type AAA domain-containing protein n=1 Tax=Vanderwaltozyma polyspora (strain ATCC 22028 / DSM 70294 / BCRC 21397 / CBS 2163 / NBRC 10782 / NRRL Y-8283 / UCD 57-17) TaxID=436907 RepID=A7TQ62_VANPO|nr:uncharacterized protein Kpol_483p10 [Vanderwaltozyma polyspora DSM 70294]EDO15591.1 hypothetical protein Kpol_483p10 [Vanderwaltozyma polyspora DSM 70294]